jgi:lipid-A-disaccharide synthase
MNEKKRIFVIAGEPSGDQHAAEYIKKHTDINPNIIFDAFGQNDIKKTNANLIYDTEKISVIGIIEVILRYRQIYQALNIAKKYIKDKKPDLIILVDYIEFNLKVAKYARNLGIPVLFYIAPQVWAWREKRAKKFVQATNHLAVIFPFEENYFKKYTNNVTYVGHPLSKVSGLTDSVKDYDQRNIDLGLFPGSRESEIKNNLHQMIDCVQKNKKETIRLFYANETTKNIMEKLLPPEYHNLLASGKDLNMVSNCKKALCASGTITLQLAMLEVPMIIMYKLSYLSYLIMKSLIKIKYIGLVNLVLGNSIGSQPIVKEFIQPSYSDQVDIMVELNRIDQDESYRKSISDNYKLIKNKLSVEPKEDLSSLADKMLDII